MTMQGSEVVLGNWQAYSALAAEVAQGPEKEGLVEADFNRSAAEANGVWLNVNDDQAESLPFVTPVDRLSTVNQDYFRRRYGEDYGNKVVFLSTFVMNAAMQQPAAKAAMAKSFSELAEQEAVILYGTLTNEPQTDQNLLALARETNIKTEQLSVLDPKNGTEASVVHFTGIPEITAPMAERSDISLTDLYRQKIASGEADGRPSDGTAVLLPELLDDALLDQIWDVYDKQIGILIEDHPVYQRLTRKELITFLEDQDSVNIARFVDGNMVCLFLGVTNVDRQAAWLRSDYLQVAYGEDEELLYCPGLVVDFEHQGHNYSKDVFGLLTELTVERGRNVRPYFECTNISAAYVPHHVFEPAIAATGLATIDVEEVARYQYRMLQLSK